MHTSVNKFLREGLWNVSFYYYLVIDRNQYRVISVWFWYKLLLTHNERHWIFVLEEWESTIFNKFISHCRFFFPGDFPQRGFSISTKTKESGRNPNHLKCDFNQLVFQILRISISWIITDCVKKLSTNSLH